MKLVLLAFCQIGLAYCVVKMVQIIKEFLKMFKMFNFATKAFNVQYRIFRPFLRKELSDAEIIKQIQESNPDDLNKISNDYEKIMVVFIKDYGIPCENSAEIRSELIKAVTLIEKLREYFSLHGIIIKYDVDDENEAFIKELRQIRYQKGEPTEYEVNHEQLETLEQE